MTSTQPSGAAPVDELGEGGGAAARGGEVGAGGDGAALAAAAAEVDRDQRQAGRARAARPGRRQRPGQAGQRPAVGGDERVVAAGVGEAGRAGDLPADRAGEAAPGVDLAAGGDGGDRGEQQQRDQRRQARLLDARRAPLPLVLVPHRADARRPRRTRGAQKVPNLCRQRVGSAYIGGDGGSPSTFSATPTSSAPAWRSSRSRCSPRSASPGPTTRSSSRSR